MAPKGANRLGRIVGKKILNHCKRLGITPKDACTQLGIDPMLANLLINGQYGFNNALYERVAAWMLKGTTFESAEDFAKTSGPYTIKADWPLIKSRIPLALYKELRKLSVSVGLSNAALIHVALKYFITAKRTQHQLKIAAKDVEEARMVQAINSSSALQQILAHEYQKQEHTAKLPSDPPIPKFPLEQIVEARQDTLSDDRDFWEL